MELLGEIAVLVVVGFLIWAVLAAPVALVGVIWDATKSLRNRSDKKLADQISPRLPADH